ncbi:MAG: hypothetical protein JKX79_12675 [Labilibaculum sp.]|nr:hypothetical protein [Labilibaculum sp.]
MKEIVKISSYVANGYSIVDIETIKTTIQYRTSKNIRVIHDVVKNSYSERRYNAITYEELTSFQTILLKAYVHAHDALEKGIETKDAANQLIELKRDVLCIRKNLITLSNYIDVEYEEKLQEFKAFIS